MSTQKKSVDEIWRELNARSLAPKSRSTGIPGFGIPGIQSQTRVIGKPSTQDPQLKAVQDTSLHHDNTKYAAHYDPEKAGVSSSEVQSYLASTQRVVNCLTDPDRSTRTNAVNSLSTKLLNGDAATAKASPQLLQVRHKVAVLTHMQSSVGTPAT